MALADEEFNQYCQALNLSEGTLCLVEQIRRSDPSRRVRSNAGNVCVRYPSQKMGCIIQAESHRVEFAGILEYEFSASVLEYYDQPPSIKISYETKDGKRVSPWHTPDFFVLREDSAGWEEWKTEDELGQLSINKPNRYVRDAAGHWRCPPGERYASQYGLSYRVRSSAEIEWGWQRNIDFLADYLQAGEDSPDPNITGAILDYVRFEPGLTLAALLQADFGGTSDDIYALIAAGQAYVDLHAAPLAEPDHVHLFRDRETARAYQAIRTEVTTHPQANASALPNPLSPQSELAAEIQELLIHASAEALARAGKRHEQIQPLLAGAKLSSTRTERDWLKKYREAERRYGSGYLGLIDQEYKKGNRTPRLDEAIRQRMDRQIETEYETIRQQGKHVAYGKFLAECEQAGLKAPSFVSYYERINRRGRYAQLKKREGAKVAYPYEPYYWELTPTTPRHGDWPFHIGHIDHTQLDIELVHSKTKRNLGRPWATFLIDAFSRRILALELSFDEPSYRSCMMVIRTLVARHQRLPKYLVVDGGREFRSIYFESLLARYNRGLKTRPAGKPRFGTVIERLFGTTNQDFIHNLLGNTQIMQKVRQVTKAVNPKEQAIWTLETLYLALCEWAYEVYDTLDHATLGQSPREAFTQGLEQTGFRTTQLIPYDETFILSTLPTTSRGQAKVEPNQGIKINYLYYWSEAFRSRSVEGQTIPVRYDPFDASVAYAFIRNARSGASDSATESGRWVRCLSEYYSRFKGRSEREIRLATAELRKQKRQHSTRFTVRAKTLANFLDSPMGQGVIEAQRTRDEESRTARQSVLPLAWTNPTHANLLEHDPQVIETQLSAEPLEPPQALEFYEDF
jgi:transposase InsO family protein